MKCSQGANGITKSLVSRLSKVRGGDNIFTGLVALRGEGEEGGRGGGKGGEGGREGGAGWGGMGRDGAGWRDGGAGWGGGGGMATIGSLGS